MDRVRAEAVRNCAFASFDVVNRIFYLSYNAMPKLLVKKCHLEWNLEDFCLSFSIFFEIRILFACMLKFVMCLVNFE